MRYSSPELVVIGRAEVLVLGEPGAADDHCGSLYSRPPVGLTLGLDD